MTGVRNSTKPLTLLSGLLLGLDGAAAETCSRNLDPQDLKELWNLANSHHVILRAFPQLCRTLEAHGASAAGRWAADAIREERARIEHALCFLEPISDALATVGNVIVMKSLDHWPDLGSDLDLFTDADPAEVITTLRRSFEAKLEARSWGDRLANKWNFVIPGLPELVEIHIGRLGQTGEQIAVSQSLVARARTAQIGTYRFRVPAPEERLIISTLQRMYRHFYIRLCDVIDNAGLVERGEVDFARLRSLARSAGLWDGLATYLAIISDYVRLYRGDGLELPSMVSAAARFRGDQVYFRRNFLRIPVLPHAAGLYASELARLLLNGEIRNTLRLSLLPGLATAAALEMKFTGSDKGIW